MPHRELYIGGKWVRPAKGKRLDVICPFDETVIGSIPLATEDDVNAAVEAARWEGFLDGPYAWPRSCSNLRRIKSSLDAMAVHMASASEAQSYQ